MILETLVKTLIGLALGTLLSFGALSSASATGTSVAALTRLPDDAVEVIVVTAKRPAAQPVDEPIEEFIVTAKRIKAAPAPTPPAMALEMPKLTLVAEPLVIRL
jgi:hypothetical protein